MTQNLVLRGKEEEDTKPYYARIGITKNKTKTNSHIAGAVYTIYGTEANRIELPNGRSNATIVVECMNEHDEHKK